MNNHNWSEEKEVYRDYFTTNISSTKHILRYLWIKENFLHSVTGKRILEIGCGDGGVIQLLKNTNYVVGIDISISGVENLKQLGIESHLCDISSENIPFEDGFFDYVLAFEVFEHLKSPQHAIEEIQRVCKKDGTVILSIPNYKTGHKFIYRSLFTFKAFENYLKDNKFLLIKKLPYGICPPFWNIIKKYVREELQGKKNNIRGLCIPLTTRLARILSSDFFTFFKPTRLCWLLVYELKNINPKGAKELYQEISEETKTTYR